MKIATHDSATGERGKGFLSWLVTPFAKTQCKTIKEQYDAGCRMFDIRVKLVDGIWRCAHGLWVSARTAEEIISEINSYEERCYATLTYEGDDEEIYPFSLYFKKITARYNHIKWGGIAIKYGEGSNILNVKYEYILPYPCDWPATEQAFLPLDGRSWHILLPIPWLWKKICHNKPEFNEHTFKFVDFL